MTTAILATNKTVVYQTPQSIVISVYYINEGKYTTEHNVIPLSSIKILTYFPRSKALEVELVSGEAYTFVKVDKIGYKSHSRHISLD